MNQTHINDDELQRAIDDITKNAVDGGEEIPNVGEIPSPDVVPGAEPDQAPASAALPVPDVPMMPVQEVPVAPVMQQVPMYADNTQMPQNIPMATNPEMQSVIPTQNISQQQPFNPSSEEIKRIKENILRDLAPILKDMNINPDQKFKLYCDMVENLGDKRVIGDAYTVVSQMTNNNSKGEALLRMIEIIDK